MIRAMDRFVYLCIATVVACMNHLVRSMDRFYAKHPHISFAIAVVAVVAIMWITSAWDKADTDALRLQMFASKGAV